MTDVSGSAASNDDGLVTEAPERPQRKSRGIRIFLRDVLFILLAAIVISFLIKTFLIRSFYIPSGSMEQTLHGATEGGDRVLVNKVMYDFTDPAPGDVVVFLLCRRHARAFSDTAEDDAR